MSNELKRVQERLWKKSEPVELSAEKVELRSLKELQEANKNVLSTIEKMDKSWKKYQDYLTNADKPFNEMMSARAEYIKSTTNITSLLNSFIDAAESLGLKASDVKEYQALRKNVYEVGNSILDTIDTFKDPSTFQ